MALPPPQEAIETLLGPSTRVTRRVDIYEEDGTTEFFLDAPVIDGTVNVDGGRDERRTLDCVLDNQDNALDNYPGGFWYDKIIKVYRGIEWVGLSPSMLRLGPGAIIAGSAVALTWDGVPLTWDGSPLTWDFNTGAPDAYLRTADSTSQNLLSGSRITLRARLAMDTWVPATDQTLASKWDTATNLRSWKFSITSAGFLQVMMSTNGTNQVTMTSSVQTGFAPLSDHYIKIVTLGANGFGGKSTWFYTSEDGLAWTQLGIQVNDTSLGSGAFFDSTTSLRIGATAQGNYLVGNISSMSIFDGDDDDRAIVNLDFTAMDGDAQAMTDINGTPFQILGETWSVLGGVEELKSWETQLGEFLVEKIDSANFPHSVSVTGRDYTKKLMEAEFGNALSFSAPLAPESIIRAIAANGGISKFILPVTNKTLAKTYTFEGTTKRWQAITDIATAFGYEVYFDDQGYMVMREYKDPVVSPVAFVFETGPQGSLAAYTKSSSDTRVYNQVVVRNENAGGLPLVAIAENRASDSPTSIDNLGRIKTYNYSSAFFTDLAEMQRVAESFLSIHSLESYDVNFDAIVIPWLEATEIIEFIDPDPQPDEPIRFLLISFNVPLKLGTMSVVSRRVRVVG